MNLILKKKYRIYRSVMATFGGWEAPANGLNIGEVVTLISIENDKNVVVQTQDGEFWYIRYTSLANLEGEADVEVVKEKGVPFDWAAYNKLIKDKRNPLPIVAFKPVNDELREKGEQVQKYVENKDEGLCSFVHNGEEALGYICYAPAMREKLKNFGVSFGRLRKKGFDTPEVRRYVEWVANESHFARYFTKSTFDEITSECHWFACQEGESKAVIAAACMIRSAYEFKAIPSIFCELVDAGVESSLAYIIATLTRGGTYDTGTGHTALYSAPVSALVGQAMRSLNTKASSIFEASGSSIHYGGDVCQVKGALIKLNIATKDGYGYFRVQQPIKKEERLKVAEVLAKLITEELNNA